MAENNANPTKKSDIDPNFEKQINARQDDAKQEERARKRNEQVHWMTPTDWQGDPFDWNGMKAPFNRDKANSDYEAAVDDPKSPGNSGDLVATTTQIDYLACMERAFRARHTYGAHQFCRPVAQSLGRKKGHGHAKGPFKQSVLQYVRDVLKQASG